MKKFILALLFLMGSVPLIFAENHRLPRIEIELSGGFATANPYDLNLIVESEKKFNQLYLNQAYTYLQNIDYIHSYVRQMVGQYQQINRTNPFEFRVKARVSQSLAFSLAVKYVNNTKNFTVSEEYLIQEISGNSSSDTVTYSPFTLAVQVFAIHAGIHYGLDLGRKFRLEGFVAAGPIFAECMFSYDYSQTLQYGDTGIRINNDMALEVKGEGSSYGWEGGVQLQYRIINRVSLFISAGYTQQKIDELNGPGTQWMYGYTEKWQGRLGIKEAAFYKPWGSATIHWPSNFWDGEEIFKQRDMTLDLSGWQLKFGLIFGI